MLRKVDYILDCLDAGEIFIHADCDIQFFDSCFDKMKNILEENDYDILGQHDGNLMGMDTMCAGFFMAKPSDKMISLFKEVREMVVSGKAGNDQLALNGLLKLNPLEVKYGLLDESYYSVWRCNGIREWKPENDVVIPDNLVMHHSNYTAGIPNKLKLMEIVRENYNVK